MLSRKRKLIEETLALKLNLGNKQTEKGNCLSIFFKGQEVKKAKILGEVC